MVVGKLEDYVTIGEHESPIGWVRLEIPFTSIAALKQRRGLIGRFMETVTYYCKAPALGAPHIAERARLAYMREETIRMKRLVRSEPSRPGQQPIGGTDGGH